MTPEAAASMLGGLTEALVGGVFGFVIAYFVFRAQQTRRVIEYEVFSMPLLRFKPRAERAITVSTDKSIMTGDVNDRGVPVQIESAYAFEIHLVNVGNDDIHQSTVDIILNEESTIVEFETQPAQSIGYSIDISKDASLPNVLHARVPFINKNNRLIIRLISTGNKDKTCEVRVFGLGVHSRVRKPGKQLFIFLLTFNILLLFLPAIEGVLARLPDNVITMIGAREETRTRVILPLWLNIIFSFVFILIFLASMRAFTRSLVSRYRSFAESWGGDAPERKGISRYLEKILGF